MRRDFTVNPFWDRVSSRDGQNKLRMDGSTHQLSDGQLTWIEGICNTEQQQHQQEGSEAKNHSQTSRYYLENFPRLEIQTQDMRRPPRWCYSGACSDFKRHCNTLDAYPLKSPQKVIFKLKITFCDDYANFFACTDLLEQHRGNPLAKCLCVIPPKANATRRETQRVHNDFKERQEGFLETGILLSQIFNYPDSSKKPRGGRNQSRLKGP